MVDVVRPAKICRNYDPEVALLRCSWTRFSVNIDRCCIWITCWQVTRSKHYCCFDKFTESLQSLNHFPTLVVETCKDCTDCTSESVTLHRAVSSANILQSTCGEMCCSKLCVSNNFIRACVCVCVCVSLCVSVCVCLCVCVQTFITPRP